MHRKIMGMPLPVVLGVVAAGLLLGIYLRRRGGGSSSTLLAGSPAAPVADQGSISGGVSGGGVAPPAPGIDPGTANDLLSGISSAAGSLDANTGAVGNLVDAIGQLVYNVPSSGGSGASAQGKQPGGAGAPVKSNTPKKAPAHVVTPAPVTRYYTYAPGKAPKGKGGAAPKAPAGKTLHFKAGHGYFYA